MKILEPFIRFDQKALDILEELCHKQQRLFGTSHYTWLKLIAVALAGVTFVFPLPISASGEHYKGWLLIVAFMLCVPGFTWWESHSLRRMQQGLANPLRKNTYGVVIRFYLAYTVTPLLVVLMLLGMLTSGRVILYGSVTLVFISFSLLYVLPACDPLPPTTGKCMEWLKSLFLKRALS
jgi:hypothetical protein